QPVGGAPDHLERGGRLDRSFGEQLGVAADRGQRRAEVVRHARLELNLAAVEIAKLSDEMPLPVQQAPKLELPSGEPAQLLERLELVRFELSRLRIEDADGAERPAGRGVDGRAGIEPDARISDDVGVVAEALVAGGVVDDHHAVRRDDRVRAERKLAWRVVAVHSEDGL